MNGGLRRSAAILLTDSAAQLCAAFFDRPSSYPRAALVDRRSQSGAIQENNGYSGVLTVNVGLGTVKINHEERLVGTRESTFELSV